MRNLKRVLSLVLALVMAMSLMVVGTSAAFKDEADFSAEYVTAAEVLTNLNVLWGYEDGSFQPKGDITRAEVAALIYRAVTGDVTDAQKDVYSAMTNDFSDVKDGQWFAGYVNFCANAKFVAGYGDGTFGPNDKVTGYQTLAMILRAIGYDHNGEFIGADWEIKTAAFAQDIGLLDNVKSEQLGQPASRELVAELIFQAMNAPMVKWVSIYEGYRPLDKDETSLGQKTFKLDEVEGVVIANEAVDLRNGNTSLDDGKTALRQTVDKKTVDTTYNLSTDISIIGEKVSVYVADKDAVSTPVSLAKVTDWSNLDAAEWTDDQEDEWADAINGSTKFYNNYDAVNEEDLFSGKGIMVKAIDNDDDDDGIYDYVLTEKADLTTIKTIATDDEIILNNVKSEDDQVIYANAKVGDVVLVISYGGTTYIEKADSINGIVTAYSTKGDIPTATIGSKSYAVSDLENKSSLNTFDSVTDTYQRGDDWNGKFYTYYQDNYGNIIAYEEAGENATEYGLILDYDVYKSGAFQGDLTWRPLDGINAGDLYVKYLTVDNEVETAKVEVDTYKHFFKGGIQNVALNKVAVGDVVSYNINEDGEFFIAHTYDKTSATVTTNDEQGVATVKNGTTTVYNVGDDLVVFYYAAVSPIRSELAYQSSDLMDTFGWVIPVYGVLTGDEAIADLETGKVMTQMDVSDKELTHMNQHNDAYMFNISGHIDTFIDYCYVEDFKAVESEKIDGEYYYTYDAIASNGSPIEVTTRWDMSKTDLDDQVYAYHSLNVNGTQINALLPVNEQGGVKVIKGDLHLTQNGKLFNAYLEKDCESYTNLDLPTVFADVSDYPEGGTTNLDAYNCATGYVVLDNDDTAAVFVTDPEDNNVDYAHYTIDGQTRHQLFGTQIPLNDCYTLTVGSAAPEHVKGTITVAPTWEGKVVTLVKNEQPCEVCVPHNDIRANVVTKIWEDSSHTVCAQNLTGYTTLEAAIANATSMDKGNTELLKVVLENEALQSQGAIYTSTAAALADKGASLSAKANTLVIDSNDLVDNGVLVLKITANDGSGVSVACPHCKIVDAVYVAVKL